jgi:hypothetical protein
MANYAGKFFVKNKNLKKAVAAPVITIITRLISTKERFYV